mmetsp:Transcript_4874/g.4117  ORF Transcript_4874/g.4117 Transcript_4874/m.4117 type:complete len:267 (+) Transcript_4874:67-867(+)
MFPLSCPALGARFIKLFCCCKYGFSSIFPIAELCFLLLFLSNLKLIFFGVFVSFNLPDPILNNFVPESTLLNFNVLELFIPISTELSLRLPLLNLNSLASTIELIWLKTPLIVLVTSESATALGISDCSIPRRNFLSLLITDLLPSLSSDIDSELSSLLPSLFIKLWFLKFSLLNFLLLILLNTESLWLGSIPSKFSFAISSFSEDSYSSDIDTSFSCWFISPDLCIFCFLIFLFVFRFVLFLSSLSNSFKIVLFKINSSFKTSLC